MYGNYYNHAYLNFVRVSNIYTVPNLLVCPQAALMYCHETAQVDVISSRWFPDGQSHPYHRFV